MVCYAESLLDVDKRDNHAIEQLRSIRKQSVIDSRRIGSVVF